MEDTPYGNYWLKAVAPGTKWDDKYVICKTLFGVEPDMPGTIHAMYVDESNKTESQLRHDVCKFKFMPYEKDTRYATISMVPSKATQGWGGILKYHKSATESREYDTFFGPWKACPVQSPIIRSEYL